MSETELSEGAKAIDFEWSTEMHTVNGFWDGTDKEGNPTGGYGPIETLKPRREWRSRGAFYRRLRHGRGWSLRDFAAAFDMTVVEVSGLERGVAGGDHERILARFEEKE